MAHSPEPHTRLALDSDSGVGGQVTLSAARPRESHISHIGSNACLDGAKAKAKWRTWCHQVFLNVNAAVEKEKRA